MAIDLKFDLMDNPEPPSIILGNRNGNKLGQLDVDAKSIDVKSVLKTSEFTFTLNKYVDGKLTNLWEKVLDFKLVYCPEWDLWYEIKVELDEATETIKTVFCTQLGQAELSQIMVYNTEINTEADIARDDYKISILYDKDNPEASTFHRIMSKAPHYSIAYIDESLKRIQKSFSFDDSSICDAFDEIEKEVGCLVVYNSNSDKNGMPKRDVSIYDLYQNCSDCGHREEFIGDECPKCHGKNIIDGYGEDTTIFVTADELATEGIELVTDTDSVKNCFKLVAGDDLMTATIRNCNPNGSDYIWYFSDAVKEDMSKELVEAIEDYDAKYKEYYDAHISDLDASLISRYNALVEKYQKYYNTPSTCINCDYKGEFENECPSCHSGNILLGKSLQPISTPVTGYSALMNAYYNTIDLDLYLKSGLMPSIEMSETKAEEQIKLLTSSALSPVAVEKIDNASRATANSAVLSMAKVLIKPTYKVEIENPEKTSFTNNDDGTKTWTGKFIVTNYSDDTDNATSESISVIVNGNKETFIKQKIEKALNKENTDDYSISGLFEKDYQEFCNELKKYALAPLTSFYESCEVCISILMAQGVGDDVTSDLYKNLYEPYYNKLAAIEAEMKLREEEISLISGVYDDGGDLIAKGLQTDIEDCKQKIQEDLNFEKCLGEKLWLEFCSYRREGKYSNSNYISDGLNNAELFEKSLEFIEVAENEIFKSAELQHSISATLNNLLAIKKFKPLVKYFKTGNWIRVQVDDRIYKLRLLEYNFSYGNLESIPVEFSDVTKIKNGTSDVKDIISQAASMASSYDSVQRQAEKGNVARSTIDQWLVDGLNSANVEIKNNDNEEVLITKNGLLARSYSDITGEYSPEQLKITHNIMAYTDDNWKTVSSALGKHEYQKWKDNQWVTDTDYGLSSKFVTAGYVTGSQIIGGEIVSSNYRLKDESEAIEAEGTYIDLINGHFSFAGGKLTYSGGDLTIVGNIEVTTSGRIGCWDINETSIYKNSPNFYTNGGMYFGTNGLSLSDQFKVEPDGIATMTGATITGIIHAEEGGTIAGFNIGDTSIYNGTDSLTSAVSGIYLGTDGIRQYGSDDANVTISEGVLSANGANISGEITATSGTFDNGTFNNCTINDTCTISGELSGATGTFSGTVSASTIEGSTIEGGSLLIGDENGYHTWISEDGILNANGVNISGEIHVSAGGTIGGWDINVDNISKNNVGISSGEASYASLMTEGVESPVRFFAGNNIDIFSEDIEISQSKSMSITINNNNVVEEYIELDEETSDNYLISTAVCSTTSQTWSDSKTTEVIVKTSDWFVMSNNEYHYGITINNAYPSWCSKNEVISVTCNTTSGLTPVYTTTILDNGSVEITIDSNSSEQLEFNVVCYYSHTETLNTVITYDDKTVTVLLTPQTSINYSSGITYDLNINLTLRMKEPKFAVLEDGSLYANSAKISGTINALAGGKIGAFNITNDGLSSDYINLNLTSIYFPTQSYFNLANNVSIYEENNVSYITTTGRKDFEIKNMGGAGVRFQANGESQQTKQKITVTYRRVAGTSTYAYIVYFDYKVEGGMLSVPYQMNVYYKQGRTVYSLLLTIPSYSNSGTCTQNVKHDGIFYQNFYGISLSESGEFGASVTESVISLNTTNNILYSLGSFCPNESATESSGYLLGDANHIWRGLTVYSAPTITSDRNEKHDIKLISEEFEEFYDELKPVSFVYNNSDSGRTHLGFIAQDVEDNLVKHNINTKDFAGICIDENKDTGNKKYFLRYEEFIPLNTLEIQKLKKRVEELENKLRTLEK